MAAKNSGNALLHLRTLFNVGAIGALSDGQLLERFATGRGEPKELAFAALVERHGPFVLRVCRSVLRDEHAAEDAFQATFLALARKAGSLWVQDSLAPWLHQAAYRAAVHDRSATIRRRSHEHAAAAHRPESVAPPPHGNDDDLEKIIHEEINRLPGRFRDAVVLCDLEGRTHEQAARHLGCAVGTVKSRLARGRKRLRGRLVRRGVASAPALAAASVGGAAQAAVPTALAESTVVYAATASAAPTSVAVITEGVLTSMFMGKVKIVMTATAVVAALAAGAIAFAQTGIARQKDKTDKRPQAGSSGWTYHILASRNGEPPRKVAVVEMTGDTPIRVDTEGALILFQPKRDGDSAANRPPQPNRRRRIQPDLRERPEAPKVRAHEPLCNGRRHQPAICLSDPLAATHRHPCLGKRVSHRDPGQRRAGREERRSAVQDRTDLKRESEPRQPTSIAHWSSIRPRSWPMPRRSLRTSCNCSRPNCSRLRPRWNNRRPN